jgi:cobyrinic acid a,c-diamide synthase
MHRFLVSAAHKSSGKTTLSIGLCAALLRKGKSVQAFKKGPDYIDPLWLAQATGRPCYNLDPYLSSSEEIRGAVARYSLGADVCLIEGNKGLFDGLALDGSNSNAALGSMLGLPVVLVLDARGMTRGIAPLILGYQAFDQKIRIAGVILNRLGGSRHESKLRAVIEHYTDVPVLGAMQEDNEFGILERHLGLAPSTEFEAAGASIERIASGVEASIDLEQLLKLTESSDSLVQPLIFQPDTHLKDAECGADFRVGIIRDRAFCFYYADDLDAFTEAGATIVYIDSLSDSALPEIDALFIGGGFPEVLASQLVANQAFRKSLCDAVDQGLPCYAECGGLMYLARSITWQGQEFPMVGALPADIVMHQKPVGRGYVHLEETEAAPWPQRGTSPVIAHEFHYSSVKNMELDVRFAYRVKRGYGIDGEYDGMVYRNVLANYAHIRNTVGNKWVARFIAFARGVGYRKMVKDSGACTASGPARFAAA